MRQCARELRGNVHVRTRQSAAWLLLGAAGQRSNPSVCCRLPGAVFHLSTPVRPSWCPNHPQSLQMLQLWNHRFHQLQNISVEKMLYEEAEMLEYNVQQRGRISRSYRLPLKLDEIFLCTICQQTNRQLGSPNQTKPNHCIV